jgi:hypothetical protein
MATISPTALTTLADVKESMGISSGDTSQDNLIIRKINQATLMIERYCGRNFLAADYTEYYDGDGGSELTLRHYPVNSVASLSYRNTTSNENDFTTYDTVDYFIDATAGRLKSLGSWWGSYDTWKVVYNAGYSTIPDDLAEVCASLAAYLANSNTSSGGTGIKSKQEGQRKIEYFDPSSSGGTGGDSIISQLGLDDVLDTYADIGFSGLR